LLVLRPLSVALGRQSDRTMTTQTVGFRSRGTL
jgi:hypothetical protein